MPILVCDAAPHLCPAFLRDLAALLPFALALAGDEKVHVAEGIMRHLGGMWVVAVKGRV